MSKGQALAVADYQMRYSFRVTATLLLLGWLAQYPARAGNDLTRVPVGAVVPDFSIKDQYGNTFQLSSKRENVIALVCGDRTGNQFMSAWFTAVKTRFPSPQDRPELVSVAILNGVPGFLHSWVRSKFLPSNASEKKGPVLLDWDGTVPRLLGFAADVTNVYLIDRGGLLKYRTAGKGTPPEASGLLEAIDLAMQGR